MNPTCESPWKPVAPRRPPRPAELWDNFRAWIAAHLRHERDGLSAATLAARLGVDGTLVWHALESSPWFEKSPHGWTLTRAGRDAADTLFPLPEC